MRWEGGRQSENVEDRRRMAPRTLAVGGGGMLLIVIIGLLMGRNPLALLQQVNQAQMGAGQGAGDPDRPETAEEIRTREFAQTILGFTEDVWSELFRQSGKEYVPPGMVLYSQRVETGGCGVAPSAVGPFYCPADQKLYLDPTFFEELEQKLGGSSAEFSQAYVIAHEIGHHVQNLLGYNQIVEQKRRSGSKAEANRWSVRLELQADYLAGVWAHHGQRKFDFLEGGDIESAIKSANAIGDDRLQRNASGFTSPENYTHGTSAQRVKWFREGLKTGDLGLVDELFNMPDEAL